MSLEDLQLTVTKLTLRIDELEKKVETLEAQGTYNEIELSGSPQYVKDYIRDQQRKGDE